MTLFDITCGIQFWIMPINSKLLSSDLAGQVGDGRDPPVPLTFHLRKGNSGQVKQDPLAILPHLALTDTSLGEKLRDYERSSLISSRLPRHSYREVRRLDPLVLSDSACPRCEVFEETQLRRIGLDCE